MVHLHELGTGPAVLLLHGSGPGTTGWGAWRRPAGALASRHRVIVPDQAGFGDTPVPVGLPGRRSLWTAQALAVLDALEVDRCAVVGHSMGGAIALSMAATQPERITRVVAVSTMGAPMPMSPALDRLWAAPSGAAGARELLGLLFDDQALVTEDAVEARWAAMEAGADAFARLFPPPRERWVRDLTLTPEELRAVRAPVLLVHGTRDRITPLADAGMPLLECLTNAALHVFGRCGHVPAVEHPEAFDQLVADYLENDA